MEGGAQDQGCFSGFNFVIPACVCEFHVEFFVTQAPGCVTFVHLPVWWAARWWCEARPASGRDGGP